MLKTKKNYIAFALITAIAIMFGCFSALLGTNAVSNQTVHATVEGTCAGANWSYEDNVLTVSGTGAVSGFYLTSSDVSAIGSTMVEALVLMDGITSFSIDVETVSWLNVLNLTKVICGKDMTSLNLTGIETSNLSSYDIDIYCHFEESQDTINGLPWFAAPVSKESGGQNVDWIGTGQSFCIFGILGFEENGPTWDGGDVNGMEITFHCSSWQWSKTYSDSKWICEINELYQLQYDSQEETEHFDAEYISELGWSGYGDVGMIVHPCSSNMTGDISTTPPSPAVIATVGVVNYQLDDSANPKTATVVGFASAGTSVTIPESITVNDGTNNVVYNVTAIAQNAFSANGSGITEITFEADDFVPAGLEYLPNSIQTINVPFSVIDGYKGELSSILASRVVEPPETGVVLDIVLPSLVILMTLVATIVVWKKKEY